MGEREGGEAPGPVEVKSGWEVDSTSGLGCVPDSRAGNEWTSNSVVVVVTVVVDLVVVVTVVIDLMVVGTVVIDLVVVLTVVVTVVIDLLF